MASSDPSAHSEALDRIFLGLKNKNAEVRLQSAQELRKHVRYATLSMSMANLLQVQTIVVEMSSDAAAKLWDENINQRLIQLVYGPTAAEKMGGILAIGVNTVLCTIRLTHHDF